MTALALSGGALILVPLSAGPAQAADAGQTCTGGVDGTCTVTFTTVGDSTWTVPAGVTQATLTVDGAQGGRPRFGGGTIGGGAEVLGTISVAPGASYTISVGGAGGDGVGGRNGGGSTVVGEGGGGGGYSAIHLAGTPVLVAGGGGGTGNCSSSAGAGGQVGEAGGRSTCDLDVDLNGGAGGTQTAGGAGGTGALATGNPGTHLAGGGGSGEGGGGGGGWYGGGQGGTGNSYQGGHTAAGGGGGSSYADPSATNVSYKTGVWTGDGRVVISYPNPVSADTSDAADLTDCQGLTVRQSAPGVLGYASGPTALTASVESGPAHGALTLNADGSFSYTADKDYIGMDSFDFRATDTDGDYAVATYSISVAPISACEDDADQFTVAFDAEGGSPTPADQAVDDGATVTEPADPTRAGHTFYGWYTKAIGGTKWSFGAPVTSDLTLHAQWTGVVVRPGSLQVGERLAIIGTGFRPGEDVRAVLHSSALPVGTRTADSRGHVEFSTRLPDDFATGGHRATLAGLDSGRRASDGFRVAAATGYPIQADTGVGPSIDDEARTQLPPPLAPGLLFAATFALGGLWWRRRAYL